MSPGASCVHTPATGETWIHGPVIGVMECLITAAVRSTMHICTYPNYSVIGAALEGNRVRPLVPF